MGTDGTGAQAKTVTITLRVDAEEKELLKELAFVRGDSLNELLHEHGVDEAVELARKVQERFAS